MLVLLVAACHDDPSAPPSQTSGVGTLAVEVSGLPEGTTPLLTLAAPDGSRRTLTGLSELLDLPAGGYELRAEVVTVAGVRWLGSPARESVFVRADAPVSAAVHYAPEGTVNIALERVQLQQSVSNVDGTIPLVAGREALLQLWITGSVPDLPRPPVRIRYYRDGALLESRVVRPGGGRLPTQTPPQSLDSYNILVPDRVVVPGLQVVVDVDPENATGETDEHDNRWPRGGGPAAVHVLDVPPLRLRLVPVQLKSGLTGLVAAQNAPLFVDLARRIYPLGTLTVEVRAPFASTVVNVDPDDTNGGWVTILGEINALRAAEGQGWHYYGVVRPNYVSGVVGRGLVPGVAAVGWDRLPGASETLAHELGHNWGRKHSPCGGPPDADLAYPYPGGIIGNYGFDFVERQWHAPGVSDVMGYCTRPWISDYTYRGVLAHRQARPNASLDGGAPVPGLLVWGRVVDGRVELEPAVPVTASPQLPEPDGPFVLTGVDDRGATAFALRFAGTRVADAEDARVFAFVVPHDPRRHRALAALRVEGGRGGPVELRTRGTASGDARLRLERDGARARLRWDAETYPAAIVRDAAGRILALPRGGDATLPAATGELEVLLSDGVGGRAERRRLP